jgi:hypothetical protein
MLEPRTPVIFCDEYGTGWTTGANSCEFSDAELLPLLTDPILVQLVKDKANPNLITTRAIALLPEGRKEDFSTKSAEDLSVAYVPAGCLFQVTSPGYDGREDVRVFRKEQWMKAPAEPKPEPLIGMTELLPMQWGVIQTNNMAYHNHLVMRSASQDWPEVIDFTPPTRQGRCWTWDPNKPKHTGPTWEVLPISLKKALKILKGMNKSC